MDISIAVSLIRGQMGAVVERAVNGAVETVLAEMLRVVGVKFEDLKNQVANMKRDIKALQREKALKEKENDNIRAKLRYTELKLKYYRQGVEEELQQRASASSLVRVHPSSFLQTQRGAELSSRESSPTCSTETKNSEGTQTKNNEESASPHRKRRRQVRVQCKSETAVSDPSALLPSSLFVDAPSDSADSSTVLFCPTEKDQAQSQEDNQEEECEWTITVHTHSDAEDTVADALHIEAVTVDPGQLCARGSSEGSKQADSSTLPSTGPQMKQEQQQQQEEVICIKEEPNEEREVTAALMMDCQVQPNHPLESQAQESMAEWAGHEESQRDQSFTFTSAGPNPYVMAQLPASLPSVPALMSSNPSRQVAHPWSADLSLYEEYKIRRNELRRVNMSRRRELEKMLPQPLLADLVRERREKTRLRVARWRAKRKLQAGLSQVQAEGGAAGLPHTGFPTSGQQQQFRAPSGSSSSSQQTQSSQLPQSSSFFNSISNTVPFVASSSSSSSLHMSGSAMAPHQNIVTSSSSSSSSSSYPQVSVSDNSLSLLDSDIIQCQV